MNIGRRRFVHGGVAASALALGGGGCAPTRLWERAAYRKAPTSLVAILGAESYERPLAETVLDGLRLFDLEVAGRTVVLKPNLVEVDPRGVINTHSAVVAAAIEAFRRLDAREVIVAEGPGHRRDTEYLLAASGLAAVLRETRTPYVDLNLDDVRSLPLQSHFTNLDRLYFPETVLRADLLVSMPKLKTHHWAGVTLSMKNLFGLIPGSVYGWPKNVLHWAGVDGSIVDINSTLPTPRFAIVDGIVGMEGNGPIQGDPKHAGVLIFGQDLAAVDAVGASVMSVVPARVRHLRDAGAFLGNVEGERIAHVGEPLERFRREFRVGSG